MSHLTHNAWRMYDIRELPCPMNKKPSISYYPSLYRSLIESKYHLMLTKTTNKVEACSSSGRNILGAEQVCAASVELLRC
jgi:hypothetical protein